MEISQIKGEIRVVPIYTCEVCGKKEDGDVLHMDIDEYHADIIVEAILNAPLYSSHMPVGWSYCDLFKCPECKHLAAKGSRQPQDG